MKRRTFWRNGASVVPPQIQKAGRKKPETWLYGPMKEYAESLDFTVKGEIGNCDLVAVGKSGSARLIIAELKTAFTLGLVLQGVAGASACDEIWLVVGLPKKRAGRVGDRHVHKLCRMLGFGLFGISDDCKVHVLVPPGPYQPRSNLKRRSELLDEHRRREGDPVLAVVPPPRQE